MATIGLYSDRGATVTCVTAAERMFQSMGYSVAHLTAEIINNDDLSSVNLFYFPGGASGPYISDITVKGKRKIRRMISSGTGYIGTCAGAVFAVEKQVWDGTIYTEGQLGIFPGSSYGPIPEIFEYPEIGMCEVNLMKPHPITEAELDSIWILFHNGPYFQGNTNAKIEIIGTYTLNEKVALVGCEFGQGHVFLTGPHPEWEEESPGENLTYMEDDTLHNPGWQLMKNAIRWCLQ